MDIFCALYFLVLMFNYGSTAMTEKQLKSGAKLYRNNCQPKTKVTDELIDNMHIGIWDEEKPAKCYMNCVLTMMKLVDKHGKFDKDIALAQMSKLPTARVQPTTETSEKCDKSGESATDKCDASWQFAKCVYFDNPEMTQSQLKAAGKLIRNYCQPKTKVTDEAIENLHKGDWDDNDKNLMCYQFCLCNRLKLVDKKGKVDLPLALKQLPQLPESYHGPIHDAIEKCKGKDDSDDKCEATYYLSKCMYFLYPDLYFLP